MLVPKTFCALFANASQHQMSREYFKLMTCYIMCRLHREGFLFLPLSMLEAKTILLQVDDNSRSGVFEAMGFHGNDTARNNSLNDDQKKFHIALIKKGN